MCTTASSKEGWEASMSLTGEDWNPMKQMETGWVSSQGSGEQWPEVGSLHGSPSVEQISQGGEERKIDLWWSGGMMVQQRQKMRDREERKKSSVKRKKNSVAE